MPCWNGGGTVKLTILTSDFNKASSTLIQSVQNAICPNLSNEGLGIAPIGHSVTVDTVEEVQINLSTMVTLSEGYSLETVTEQITSVLNRYLLELRKTWEDNNIIIRIEQIKARILDVDGVLDITTTAINNSASNIELLSNQICILGEVNVS